MRPPTGREGEIRRAPYSTTMAAFGGAQESDARTDLIGRAASSRRSSASWSGRPRPREPPDRASRASARRPVARRRAAGERRRRADPALCPGRIRTDPHPRRADRHPGRGRRRRPRAAARGPATRARDRAPPRRAVRPAAGPAHAVGGDREPAPGPRHRKARSSSRSTTPNGSTSGSASILAYADPAARPTGRWACSSPCAGRRPSGRSSWSRACRRSGASASMSGRCRWLRCTSCSWPASAGRSRGSCSCGSRGRPAATRSTRSRSPARLDGRPAAPAPDGHVADPGDARRADQARIAALPPATGRRCCWPPSPIEPTLETLRRASPSARGAATGRRRPGSWRWTADRSGSRIRCWPRP